MLRLFVPMVHPGFDNRECKWPGEKQCSDEQHDTRSENNQADRLGGCEEGKIDMGLIGANDLQQETAGRIEDQQQGNHLAIAFSIRVDSAEEETEQQGIDRAE